jgi:hypothetical protein
MNYPQTDMYQRTGDWLVDTARRKPEALLLMAAGCALLMRSGRRRPVRSAVARWEMGDDTVWDPKGSPAGSSSASFSGVTSAVSKAAERISRYAGTAADSVSNTAKSATDSVSNTAKDYASNVMGAAGDYADTARQTVSDYAERARRAATDYAADARRNISETSDRLKAQGEAAYVTASEAIREQPILVAALGLAAGAALAAFFPATEIEKRTMGAAGAALATKAAEAGENLLSAATQAGERLKETASERGLDTEGLKEIARDVAGTFTGAAAGSQRPQQSSGIASSSVPRKNEAGFSGAQSPDAGRAGSGKSPQHGLSSATKENQGSQRSSGNVPGRS